MYRVEELHGTILAFFLGASLPGEVGEFIHRVLVFTGFVMGFCQIRELKWRIHSARKHTVDQLNSVWAYCS